MSYPPLKITFLGTGTSSGVPMIACDCEVCTSPDKKDNRLRSSILVQSPATTFVVDTGPDFRCQMLREKIKHLDAVLFTHSHKDHMSGLDDVKAFNFFSKKSMDVYAEALTEEAIRREFYYAFSGTSYPGIPQLDLHTITLQPFVIGDIPVIPILVWHLKMPVFGFRFGKFTYITDANSIDDTEKDKIRGSEIVVINALRKQKHVSHFTLGEAIDLVNEINVPQAWFTHLSHQMGLHEEVEKELPDGMHIAYDGLQIQVNN
ncbi:MAG: beta-lactamase domain protein [Chitinophagaceae bacterium]|nr:beta-lactamase domain protein [Chitinophagaceae bacterium]